MPDDKRICASVIFDENRFVRLNKNLPTPAPTGTGRGQSTEGDRHSACLIEVAICQTNV